MQTVAVVQLATENHLGYEAALTRTVGALLVSRLNRSEPVRAAHVEVRPYEVEAVEAESDELLVFEHELPPDEAARIARDFHVQFWLTGRVDVDELAGSLSLSLSLGSLGNDTDVALAPAWTSSFYGELDEVASVLNRAAIAVVSHLGGDDACRELAGELPVETRCFDAFRHYSLSQVAPDGETMMRHLEQACACDPWFVEARSERAIVALQNSDLAGYAESLGELLQSAQLRPRSVMEHIERLASLGYGSQALELGQLVARIRPGDDGLVHLVGELAVDFVGGSDPIDEGAFAELGRVVGFLENHLIRRPNDFGALASLGALCHGLEDSARISLVRRRLERLGEDERAQAFHQLGAATLKTGFVEPACEYLQRAERLSDGSERIRCDLAAAWIQAGRFAEAEALLNSGDLSSDNVVLTSNRALALRHLGELDEAETLALRAIDLDPQHPQAWAILGDLHRTRGDLAAAREAFTSAIATDPHNPYWRRELGRVLFHIGDMEAALDEFRHVMALQPEFVRVTPEMLFMMAQAAEADQGLASAEALLRQALELSPDLWQAANNLGVLLLRQGRHTEAIEWLERALVLAPENDGIRQNLTRARAAEP